MTGDRSDEVMGILLLCGGIVAVGGACVAALIAVGFGVPNDVIFEVEGRVLGGDTDRLLAGVAAIVGGSAGIVCLLRARALLSQQ
jgi:hypothetical protein